MDFLAKALSALPSVAGSPLALGAYLAAIVAWVVIAWRVNRNKQLLRNLDKLPERVRLEALRMEMGAVRLKSGLSPEQWLRSRIHLYYFLGFAILALVGMALFTISAVTAKDPGTVGSDVTLFQENPGEAAAPSAVPPGAGGVRFASLQVENAYDGSGSQGIEFDLGDYSSAVTLQYVYDRAGQEIRIRPEMPYLSLLEHGGPITSLNYSDSPFRWQFPKLSVKVVNNTGRTLLLSEAIIDVKRSSIYRDPVLVIPYSYDLVLVNEGWGNVNDPRVELGIAEREACTDPAIENAPRPITVDLNSFRDSSTIPIRVGGYVPEELAGKSEVCVHGTIAFRTDEREERNLKLRARVPIGDEGFGAAEEPSYFYDVFLEAGRAGQSKRVAVSHTIKPGEADHFVFRIASDKSARFDLGLSLRDASGAILPLQDVRLDLFVPRSQAGYAAGPVRR